MAIVLSGTLPSFEFQASTPRLAQTPTCTASKDYRDRFAFEAPTPQAPRESDPAAGCHSRSLERGGHISRRVYEGITPCQGTPPPQRANRPTLDGGIEPACLAPAYAGRRQTTRPQPGTYPPSRPIV